jgi:hypothetical protein
MRSDGHPSYPLVARNLNFNHEIVNHSMGFLNSDGQSTNLIENLWLHLKSEIKSRYGVIYCKINRFLEEFCF